VDDGVDVRVPTREASSSRVQEYGVPALRAMARGAGRGYVFRMNDVRRGTYRGWVVGGVLVAATLATFGGLRRGTTSATAASRSRL
jgi:hypothetical protein